MAHPARVKTAQAAQLPSHPAAFRPFAVSASLSAISIISLIGSFLIVLPL